MISKVNGGTRLLGLRHLTAARTNRANLRQTAPVATLTVTSLYLRASNQLRGVLHQLSRPRIVLRQGGLNLQASLALIVHARGAQLHERRASGTTRIAGVLQLLGAGIR